MEIYSTLVLSKYILSGKGFRVQGLLCYIHHDATGCRLQKYWYSVKSHDGDMMLSIVRRNRIIISVCLYYLYCLYFLDRLQNLKGV